MASKASSDRGVGSNPTRGTLWPGQQADDPGQCPIRIVGNTADDSAVPRSTFDGRDLLPDRARLRLATISLSAASPSADRHCAIGATTRGHASACQITSVRATRRLTAEPGADYAYLLGLYLGDGNISPAAIRARRVCALQIMCADAWPGLLEELPEHANHIATWQKRYRRCTGKAAPRCSRWWKHWPCLLPQHGPGRKHERRIELAPWQQRDSTDVHPAAFVEGSSTRMASSFTNRVRRRLVDGDHGMSIRGTCSPTNRQTSSNCAARLSIFRDSDAIRDAILFGCAPRCSRSA